MMHPVPTKSKWSKGGAVQKVLCQLIQEGPTFEEI